MPAAAAKPSGSLHEGLLVALRDFIVEGNLADGARVPERALCERFNISRTPLREALKVLAAEGLIGSCPIAVRGCAKPVPRTSANSST